MWSSGQPVLCSPHVSSLESGLWIPCFCFLLPVSICLFVCLSVSGVPEVCAGAFNLCSPCFVRQSLSLNLELTTLIESLASKPKGSLCFFCLPGMGFDSRCWLLGQAFSGCQGSNSGSHGYTASVLLAEQSGQPLHFQFYQIHSC